MADVVTREDLENAKLDVATLAEVVNGAAAPGTVMNREGSAIKTLAKLNDEHQSLIDAQAVQEENATASAANAAAAAISAQAGLNFRSTFAEAIADFAVGVYFTCIETGLLRTYRRTGVAPFYVDQGDAAAPIGKTQLDASPRFAKLTAHAIVGSTDDEAAFQAAENAAAAAGQIGVALDKAVTIFKPILRADVAANWSAAHQRPHNISPGQRIDAAGTLLYSSPIGGWGQHSTIQANCTQVSEHLITAAVAAGARQVQVSSTAGLGPGDWVLRRCGDIPYDLPETINWDINQVDTVDDATHVTLRDPFSKAFTAPELAAATLNKYLIKIIPITDELDTDFEFAAGNDTGIDVQGMVNGRIRSVTGPCPGQCATTFQFSKGVVVDRVNVRDNRSTGPNTGAAGRCAESEVRFIEHVTANIIGPAYGAEAGSRVRFDYLQDTNCDAPGRGLLTANSDSHYDIGAIMMLGLGGQVVFNPVDGPVSTLRARRVVAKTTTEPDFSACFLGKEISEELVLELTGHPRETFAVHRGKWVKLDTLLLRNDHAFTLARIAKNTIVAGARIKASSGVTAGVTINLNYTSNTGGSELTPYLIAGKAKEAWLPPVSSSAGVLNGSLRRTEELVVGVYCPAIGGGVPDLTGQFIEIELFVVPDSDAWAAGVDVSNTLVTMTLPYEEASYAFDPPSLGSGIVAYTYVAFSGSKIGDYFLASFSPANVQVAIFAQALDDGGTVGVAIKNLNVPGDGSPAVDLASGFINLRRIKR